MRIEAEGLTAAQLPEIKPFPSNGIKQYADQPAVDTVLQSGKLIGVREEKFAIVPTQSGKMILPEVRLYWWDTEMNQQEVIVLPPKVIEVAPGEVVSSDNNTMPVPRLEEGDTPSVPVITKEWLLF